MIIGNGKIITNDSSGSFIEKGAIYVKEDIIEDIGSLEEIKSKYPDEEFYDVEGNIIMPGMICAHSHIYSAYARGMSVSKPTTDFTTVLENLWWSLDRKLTLEDVKLNALTTYIESVQNGVTTLVDHHSGPNSVVDSLFTIAEAAKEVGVRTSLCYEVSDRDGNDTVLEEVRENINFIKECQKNNDNMIKALFGLHASFTISDKTLYKVKESMEGVYDGYHVHVAEGIEDQFDCLKKHGKRVVERLHDFQLLGKNTIVVHGVHINKREIDILKQTDTNIVHNPESNMNNAVGCPPVSYMIKNGLRVGLGTDAYTQDMFESIKVAKILQSHQLCDPTVGFNEAKAMMFDNNPKIMSNYFKNPLGIIKGGANADIIVVDYDPLTPIDNNNWFGHVVFGMSGRMVTDTIINGKFVMKKRNVQTVDSKRIMALSRERAKQIWPMM